MLRGRSGRNEILASARFRPQMSEKILGLLPAAGRGKRIGHLPCSKEVYPIGFDDGDMQPKPACRYLLGSMAHAGVKEAMIITNKHKLDIPAYLGSGNAMGMSFLYMVIEETPGVPFTLDYAFPFLEESTVAFGFPDIVFETEDAFSKLFQRYRATGASAVLGLFPSRCPELVDTVDIDPEGRIRRIRIKDSESKLKYSWAIAVWSYEFTQFLHSYVLAKPEATDAGAEIYLGHVFQAAIVEGLAIEGVSVSSAPFHDIGTPKGLFNATKTLARNYQ